MTPLRVFAARVRALFRRGFSDEDLQREIAAHLAEAAEEYVRRGFSPEAARQAALRSFGGVAQIEEEYRERRSFRAVEDFRGDLSYAVRLLRRSPGFAVVVLIVLALGVGGITAIFTLLNRIVFEPLPFPHSDRIVVVKHTAPGVKVDELGLSSGLYFHYQEHADSLDVLGVYARGVSTFRRQGSGAQRIRIAYTSDTVFQVLGVRPAAGRLFTPDDGAPGFMNMKWTVPALLAHDFWIEEFGGDAQIVGSVVTIGDNPRKVIGVMPRGFAFPDPDTQIWILLEPPRASSSFARVFNWDAIARLHAGVSANAAQRQLRDVLPRIVGTYPDATPERLAEMRLSPIVVPLKGAVIGEVGRVLWPLFGGMALMLAIAWTNAAALFAVRSESRRREVAVRKALGAPRFRIVCLFVTEAVVLTTAAMGLGLALAKGLLGGVTALSPEVLPRAAEIRLGAAEAGFAACLAITLGIFYGWVSAFRHDQACGLSVLAGEDRVTRRGGRWAIDGVIAIQIALALTLLVGSALMIRTYSNLSRRELGFAPDRLLTMQIGIPGSKARGHVRIYHDLVQRIGALAGVDSASIASFVPLTGSEHAFPIDPGTAPIPFKFFVPGYFQTMETPMLAGERFGVDERVGTPYPVLVSAALARRLYPDGRALGKMVRRLNEDGSVVTMGPRGSVPPFVIAGVVADVREISLRGEPTEIVYIPLIEPHVEQSIVPTSMTIVARTRVPPLSVAGTIRETVIGMDPALSVGRIQTMDSIVRRARGREAFVGGLLLLAAAVSLFLAVVGIYGSVAHVVNRRTREIGIRMALGGRRSDVVQLVSAGSLRAVVVGAGVGLIVSLAAARTLRSILFGVGPGDPFSFAAVIVVLLTSAIAATLAAATRAARVDPAVALRMD